MEIRSRARRGDLGIATRRLHQNRHPQAVADLIVVDDGVTAAARFQPPVCRRHEDRVYAAMLRRVLQTTGG